ncbi:MAG: hypothetical protein ACKOQM_11975 [Novosphingobium sp.]
MSHPIDPVFTPSLKLRFLDELSQHGNVRVAASRIGVSRSGLYLARRRDAAFAAGWLAALREARWHAEAVLAERALDGVEEQVFYRGEVIATRRRYDTRLLLAHLARLDALCAEPSDDAPFDLALARAGGVEAGAPLPPRAAHLALMAERAGKRFEGATTPPDPDDPFDYDPETAADYENPAYRANREVDAAYEEAEARYDAAQADYVAAAVAEAEAGWNEAHCALATAVDAALGCGPLEIKSRSGPAELPHLDPVHSVHSGARVGTPPGTLGSERLERGARGHGGDRQQRGGDHGAGKSHGLGLSGSSHSDTPERAATLAKVRHAAGLSTAVRRGLEPPPRPLVCPASAG